MKKVFLIFCFLLIATSALASNAKYQRSSGVQTDDALITTCTGGRCWFGGIVVMTDGSNAVTVDIYDNTATGGTELIPTWTVTTSATDRYQTLSFNPPIPYSTGIYVDIDEGQGSAEYLVTWED